MRKLLLLSVLISGVCFAQEETKINKYLKEVYDNEQIGIKRGDEWVVSPGDDVAWDVISTGILIFVDDKYGLLTQKGDWILKPEYTDIEEFYGAKSIIGYTVKNEKNELAYFSREGKLIIPFEQQDLECYQNVILSSQGDYQVVYDLNGQVLIPKELQQIDVYISDKVLFIYKGGQSSVYVDMGETTPKNVTLVDHYYGASQLEVSIFDYYLFLAYLQNEPGTLQDPVTGQNFLAKDFFPDTTKVEMKVKSLWRELIAKISDTTSEFSQLETMSDFGYKTLVNVPLKLNAKQLKLAAFPVTGISYEAASKYAEWLSLMYLNYFWHTQQFTWKFQLPDEEQWEKLALAGLGETMKQNQVLDSVNKQGCFLFNYAGLPDCKSLPGYLKSSLGGGSAPVKSFNADLLGCYSVFGNVAEMTAIPGLSKGGSYMHKPYESKIKNKIPYSGPQPWLGFRLIAIPVPIG